MDAKENADTVSEFHRVKVHLRCRENSFRMRRRNSSSKQSEEIQSKPAQDREARGEQLGLDRARQGKAGHGWVARVGKGMAEQGTVWQGNQSLSSKSRTWQGSDEESRAEQSRAAQRRP